MGTGWTAYQFQESYQSKTQSFCFLYFFTVIRGDANPRLRVLPQGASLVKGTSLAPWEVTWVIVPAGMCLAVIIMGALVLHIMLTGMVQQFSCIAQRTRYMHDMNSTRGGLQQAFPHLGVGAPKQGPLL